MSNPRSANGRGDRRAVIQSRASALAGPQRAHSVRTEAPAGGDQQGSDDAVRTVAELWLYGVVGGWWYGFDAETVATALRGLDVDELRVRVHSPGGNAIDGIAIGNLLRNHDAHVIVVVDGLAASAASVIALAGDEVVMSPGSQMMLHDPWMLTVGNAAELRSDADFLDKQATNYAEVYAHRAQGTGAGWREVMLADGGRGTWYTAQEAVDAGLADRVGTVVAASPPPPEPATDDFDGDDDMAARAAWDLEVLVSPAARAAWSGPKPPTASADGPTHTEGGSAVAFSDEQLTTMRQKLGLAENADEATILAALDEALTERADPPAAPTTPAAAVPDGMVIVEAAVLDDLRSGAEDGRAARRQLSEQARDEAIDAAIRDGRTTPARREHWENSWSADAEGTRDILASLAPGLAVPTAEAGHGGEPDTTSSDDELYALVYGDEKKGA